MAGGIEVPIDGDISPLLATFAELPGRTQDEMRAVGKIIQDEATKGQIYKGFLAIEGVSEKSAKRATAAVLKEMQSAAKEAEKTTAAAAKAAETATNDVKKGATVLLGGVVGDIEDVVGALGAMGPAAVAASGAVAVMAGGLAALWAEYKVVGMLYEFADATGKLKDEQKALSVAIDSTKQAIGDRFVPVFEGAIIGVTAGVLAIRDFTLRALDAASATITWYKTLPTFAKALIGNVAPALQQADAIDKLSEGLRTGTIDAGGYVAQARSLVGGLAAVEAVSKRTTAAVHETTAAKNEAANAAKAAAEWEEQYAYEQAKNAANWIAQQQAINRANDAPELDRQRRLAWLAEYDKKAAQLAIDEQARAQAVALAQQQAALQTASQWGSTIQSLGGLFEQLSAIIIGNAEDGSEAQKKAALVAFRVNQAASIAAIAINTAVAIVKALAEMGPVAGGLAAIGIGATGLAQAAAVAATPPPTFHVGGVVGEPGRVSSSGPNAPDEVMVRARRGERVVPRGQDAAPAPVIVMQYNHRLFDLAEGDRAKRASPYRSLAMHGKTVGRK